MFVTREFRGEKYLKVDAMAPKKGQEEAPKRIILGRSTNNLKMGIVGLPNVGKSSLFNTLSKLSVAAENFPFCTIEPNVAKVNGKYCISQEHCDVCVI